MFKIVNFILLKYSNVCISILFLVFQIISVFFFLHCKRFKGYPSTKLSKESNVMIHSQHCWILKTNKKKIIIPSSLIYYEYKQYFIKIYSFYYKLQRIYAISNHQRSSPIVVGIVRERERERDR